MSEERNTDRWQPPADLLTWNAHGLRFGRHLGAMLDREHDLIHADGGTLTAVSLQEVRYLYDALPAIARRHGLVVHQEKPRDPSLRPMPEAGSSALLVPKGWRTWTIGLEEEWEVFSHNTRHRGRRLPVGVGRPKGWDDPLKLIGSHGPTNGMDGGNARAYREYVNRLGVAKDNTREDVAVAAVGDHNDDVKALQRRFPQAKIKGRGVDSAITWGLKRVEWSEGPTYGSDHRLGRVTLYPHQ